MEKKNFMLFILRLIAYFVFVIFIILGSLYAFSNIVIAVILGIVSVIIMIFLAYKIFIIKTSRVFDYCLYYVYIGAYGLFALINFLFFLHASNVQFNSNKLISQVTRHLDYIDTLTNLNEIFLEAAYINYYQSNDDLLKKFLVEKEIIKNNSLNILDNIYENNFKKELNNIILNAQNFKKEYSQIIESNKILPLNISKVDEDIINNLKKFRDQMYEVYKKYLPSVYLKDLEINKLQNYNFPQPIHTDLLSTIKHASFKTWLIAIIIWLFAAIFAILEPLLIKPAGLWKCSFKQKTASTQPKW